MALWLMWVEVAVFFAMLYLITPITEVITWPPFRHCCNGMELIAQATNMFSGLLTIMKYPHRMTSDPTQLLAMPHIKTRFTCLWTLRLKIVKKRLAQLETTEMPAMIASIGLSRWFGSSSIAVENESCRVNDAYLYTYFPPTFSIWERPLI